MEEVLGLEADGLACLSKYLGMPAAGPRPSVNPRQVSSLPPSPIGCPYPRQIIAFTDCLP